MTVLKWCLTALALGLLGATGAGAQSFPDKPIRIVVPFPPGGGADGQARIIGQRLSEVTGQPVIIDNRAGANGAIGTAFVAKAAPDGYTLLAVTTGQVLITPAMSRNPGFRLDELTPVIGLSRQPFFLVVPGESPLRSLKDLLAAGRSDTAATFASAGAGSMTHLLGVMLNSQAGTRFNHIPYKGGGEQVKAMLTKDVTFTFLLGTGSMGQFQSGLIRPLAILDTARSDEMPGVPTTGEAGLDGFTFSLFLGLMAPAHTPKPVVDELYRRIAAILEEPGIRSTFRQMVAVPWPATPNEFSAVIRKEGPVYEAAVKRAGLVSE